MVLQGCSGSDYGLNSDKPITLILWHYYSGSQKQAFDELMDELSETQGKKQGVNADVTAKGSTSNISADLKSSPEKKVNVSELSNTFAIYGGIAEDMEKTEKPVPINDCMSDEEMTEYVDDYMKDDSPHDHAYANISPIAKAMEVMVINRNMWDELAKRENARFSDLDTWEGLTRISGKYYTYNGGKALFVGDTLMSCLGARSEQLGTPLFSIAGHIGSFTVSGETMRKLWDQYYAPFIKGYYVKNGRFANDNMKTEDVVACVSSSAEATFSSKETVRDNGTGYAAEYIVRGVPSFEGKEGYAVTRGAGMTVSKNDETREYISVQFLKQFTGKGRDILFSVDSFYLPVKKEAGSFASWNTITEAEEVTADQLVGNVIKTSMETISTGIPTSQESFNGSYEICNYLETALNEKCAAGAHQIQQAVKNKDNRKKAQKPYLSDENSNTWSEQVIKDINEKMKGSGAQYRRTPCLADC